MNKTNFFFNIFVKSNSDDDGEVIVKDDKEEKEQKKVEQKIKEYVFIVKNGIVKQIEVNSGIQDNDFIEIKSGIQKNDEIICGPYRVVSKTLNESSKIKIVKKEDLYKTDN